MGAILKSRISANKSCNRSSDFSLCHCPLLVGYLIHEAATQLQFHILVAASELMGPVL